MKTKDTEYISGHPSSDSALTCRLLVASANNNGLMDMNIVADVLRYFQLVCNNSRLRRSICWEQ